MAWVLALGPRLDRIGGIRGVRTGAPHDRHIGRCLQRQRSHSPCLRAAGWFPLALDGSQQAQLKAAIQALPEKAGGLRDGVCRTPRRSATTKRDNEARQRSATTKRDNEARQRSATTKRDNEARQRSATTKRDNEARQRSATTKRDNEARQRSATTKRDNEARQRSATTKRDNEARQRSATTKRDNEARQRSATTKRDTWGRKSSSPTRPISGRMRTSGGNGYSKESQRW